MIVTLAVPAAVGVPEMTPVTEFMLKPAGNPVADQVAEGVPVETQPKLYAVPTTAFASAVVVIVGAIAAAANVLQASSFLDPMPFASTAAIST